jgi:hypothetical protein
MSLTALENGSQGGKIANAFNSGCLACSDSNLIVVPDIDVAFAQDEIIQREYCILISAVY